MSSNFMKHCPRVFLAVSFLLSASFVVASPKEPAAPAVQNVQVYPNYYLAGGKRFVDLDRLDDWVKATESRSLEFHTCMWTATEQLAAAIERFKHVYLDVRWIAPGTAGCPAVNLEARPALRQSATARTSNRTANLGDVPSPSGRRD